MAIIRQNHKDPQIIIALCLEGSSSSSSIFNLKKMVTFEFIPIHET